MDIFAYSMLCFTSLFTLMDPLGVMPVFLQMTEGMSAGERRSIALKSCALTFVILVLFTLCGRFLFHGNCVQLTTRVTGDLGNMVGNAHCIGQSVYGIL